MALALAPTGDHEDAIAAAALRGLDDETIEFRHDRGKAAHVALVGDNAVQVRNRHPGLNGQLLGQSLVINTRVKSARIQTHDEVGVALVEPEHPDRSQAARHVEHHWPPRARNRRSSVRR